MQYEFIELYLAFFKLENQFLRACKHEGITSKYNEILYNDDLNYLFIIYSFKIFYLKTKN